MHGGLTLRVAGRHQAAQQSGDGQSQEGGVRVAVPPQKLGEEQEERRQPRRRSVTFELQKVLAVKTGQETRAQLLRWQHYSHSELK